MLFLAHAPELNTKDLDIYKYIVTHMEAVIYMRIRDLAKETQTSTATILRFCKKFGCEGFSEFKIKLQIYQAGLTQSDQGHEVDESVFLNFIHRTREERFQEKMREAAKLMAEKELILFIGEGTSETIAEYGARCFSTIANLSLRVEDIASTRSAERFSKDLAGNMCLVALSVSGETKAIVNFMNRFMSNQSTIISITNSANSLAARLSDINLSYYFPIENKGDVDLTSQVPAVYVLEYLATEVRRIKSLQK